MGSCQGATIDKREINLGGCVKTKNSEKLPFILTVSLPHKY